jgi:hypothetical protein
MWEGADGMNAIEKIEEEIEKQKVYIKKYTRTQAERDEIRTFISGLQRAIEIIKESDAE